MLNLRNITTLTLNSTPQNIIPAQPSQAQALTYLDVERTLNTIITQVYPIIGIVGIIGNITSCVVLKKTGLNQPSNIFLLALAVADTIFLLWAVDGSTIVHFVHGRFQGIYKIWDFPYSVARILFYINMSILVLSRFAQRVSATITVVIGFERLIAVFFPLKFVSIVTIRRAWFIVAGTVVFWLPWSLFVSVWFELHAYTFGDGYVYGSQQSHIFTNQDVQFINVNIVNHLSHTIPLILVTSSSIILFIKVTLTRRRRVKLVSSSANQKSASPSRTSITLLMVCSVYSFSRFLYILENLPFFDVTDYYWTYVSILYYFIRDAFLFINSACNFFIYVVFNPKFRKTFVSLLCRIPRSNRV